MPDDFLRLADDDRRAILNKAAQESGKGANVLEKDVWVCWTLEKLVTMPNIPPLAFKGGTSLSKVYNAISRFSEDVDVTLDRNTIAPDLDPFKDISNSKRRKICKALDESLVNLITKEIKPYFDSCLRSELNDGRVETRIGDVEGQLIIPYPSCYDLLDAYMPESILLELGGKNSIEPTNIHVLKPYLENFLSTVDYPTATVPVLAVERTFWEKATLIHAECNRSQPRKNVNKLSRHWYDLAQLLGGTIGPTALGDRALLEDVVRQKNVLYYAGYANYEACLNGGLRLVPEGQLLELLAQDFRRMEDDGMFWFATKTFAEVIERLSEAEFNINDRFNKS